MPEVTQPESEGAGVCTVSVISPQRLSSSANFITAQKNIYLVNWVEFVVVQSLSCVRLFATPWTAACQAPLSITISWSLLRFMFTKSMLPPNHLILCHPFSSHLQSSPASGSYPMGQLFASGSQTIGASASASVLPMNIQG